MKANTKSILDILNGVFSKKHVQLKTSKVLSFDVETAEEKLAANININGILDKKGNYLLDVNFDLV